MPTLKEYILTLRTYNPGITDKTITLYLLKLGKRIEDIEQAFKESNPQPATSPVEMSVPVATTPSVGSFGTYTHATDIEVMPPELSSQPTARSQPVQPIQAARSMQPVQSIQLVQAAAQSISASQPMPTPPVASTPAPTLTPFEQTEIHHQSFDHLIRLQDMIKDLDAKGISEDDLIIEPVLQQDTAVNTVTGMEQKNMPGSSMQRKKFSYEEIFGDSKIPVVEKKDNVVSESAQKDPTISYVGGSIVAGQGGGAFAFNASPTATAHTHGNIAEIMAVAGEKNVEKDEKVVESSSMQPVQPISQTSQALQIPQTSQPQTKGQPTSPIPMAQGLGPRPVDIKINIQSAPHNRSGLVKKIVLFVLVLSIIFGGIFGYTRYVHGVYLFVKAPYAVDSFITELGKHLASIQTAEYEVALSISGVTPVESEEVFTGSAKALSLPLGSKIGLGIEGTYQKDATSRDNTFSIKGSYADSGMKLDVDVDSITNDGIVYIKINAIPTFFGDLSQIQGKWISVDPADIATLFGTAVPLTETSTSSRLVIMENLKKVVDAGIFTVVGEPEKVTVSGQKPQYVYEVVLHFDKLFAFMQELGSDEVAASQELMSPEMRKYIDYLGKHTKTLITVDSKGKLVEMKIQSDTTTVKKENKKQKTVAEFKITTKNLNQSIKIQSPEKVDMNIIDAYTIITGQSKDTLLFERQLKNVIAADRDIMYQLDVNGKVPASLKEIVDTKKTKVKDIFANPAGDFGYLATIDGGYELTYNIKLPPVPASDYRFMDTLTIGPDATSNARTGSVEKYNTGINPIVKKPALTLRFVEGKNTATTDVLSKEALVTLNKDADKDGLSDTLEAYLGLNSAKADTDGDGKSDMAELRQGTNPKGPGSWVEGYGGIVESDMFKGDIE
jgi:hypothetical protein